MPWPVFGKLLPNLRRVYATKQAGGVIALVGWAERPLANTADEARKRILADIEQLRKTGQLSYKSLPEQPWAVISQRDYEDGGKQRRDIALAVVANRGCLFSMKFSRAKLGENEAVWGSLDHEFQRTHRVIGNYESGKPWVLNGIE